MQTPCTHGFAITTTSGNDLIDKEEEKIMEKITKYFSFDYKNDTTIEWVSTGNYSMLNCSFTSEDEDYGTDTIHYGVGSKSVKPIEQMAYEMLGGLTPYLNKMDRGDYRDISDDVRKTYGDYSLSTLYAIEKALKSLADEYRAKCWFGCLEDTCREIAKRIIKDGERKFSFCTSNQEEWDSFSPEEYEQMGAEWYGIKRLDPVFDEASYEYIVAIGYYGGGCFTSAYSYDDGLNVEYAINDLAREICKAIMRITDLKEQSIVFATEEKEEK